MSDNADVQHVPISALSRPCTMLVRDSEDTQEFPVELLARTHTVLDHWYWGPMIHDFDGLKHPERIPVNYYHMQTEPIGYIDQFSHDAEGLKLTGELVSIAENDRADEIRKKHSKKIPYQVSIEYPHDDLVIEYVPAGETVAVNGEELRGPLTVFREWTLTGVAICLHGYDPHTSTRMQRDSQHVDLLVKGGSAMPQAQNKDTKPENPPTPPEKKKEKETELQQQPPESTPAPATDPKAEVMTELKRFTDRFGAEGATYYMEGLSYEQALDKHARTLETQQSSKDATIADLQTKLSQVATGEEAPVSAGKVTGEETPKRGGTDLSGCIRIVGRQYANN